LACGHEEIDVEQGGFRPVGEIEMIHFHGCGGGGRRHGGGGGGGGGGRRANGIS
jgi:hypothetical protein